MKKMTELKLRNVIQFEMKKILAEEYKYIDDLVYQSELEDWGVDKEDVIIFVIKGSDLIHELFTQYSIWLDKADSKNPKSNMAVFYDHSDCIVMVHKNSNFVKTIPQLANLSITVA